MADEVLVVTRSFEASAERVFDAWLDPKLARKFLFTTAESEVVECEIDARPDGKFRIVDRRAEHGDTLHLGEYLEIDRPRRLVFTFAVPQYDPAYTRVEIDIEPSGSGCRLTLTHHGVPPEWRAQTTEGWGMILDAEAAALGA